MAGLTLQVCRRCGASQVPPERGTEAFDARTWPATDLCQDCCANLKPGEDLDAPDGGCRVTVIERDHIPATLGDLRQLEQLVDDVLDRLDQAPSFELAQKILNDVGIHAARRAVDTALAGIADAQAQLREAETSKKIAKDAYDQALADASWAAECSLVVDGNKTYVDVGGERRALAASDRAAHCKRVALQDPSVMGAGEGLRHAEQQAAAMADGVSHAEKRFLAARLHLEACMEELKTLRTSLSPRSNTK